MSDHQHAHPVQPPEGSLLAPGPCRACGKPYEPDRGKASVLGQLDDGINAMPLRVGTAGGKVTLGSDVLAWHLTSEQADELCALLIAALWQAEREGARNG